MSGKKILILSSSHLCRNPRVLKEAATLGGAGHDVTVLSVSTRAHYEELDRALMRDQPFRRVTLDHASAAARLASLRQRGLTWGARKLCQTLGIESPQALGPAAALLQLARRFPADLTIAHTEIPTWAAQFLIADGRRVALDVEDWYSEDLLFGDRRSRPIALLRQAEEFGLRHARYSSATSQAMADALTAAYACPPPLVIRNTFPLQPRSRADAAGPNPVPRLIWFSQTVGPGRGLELFLAAWLRTTQPSQLCLLGALDPAYHAKLLRRVPAERRERIEFLPLVSVTDLPEALVEFDVGLALEPNRPANKNLTISNKIFQYMNAGLAVVATDTAGQLEVMQAAPDCGVVIAAHETTAFAQQLDALVGDRARLRAAQQAARAAAERQFCWEREAPQLLAAVERALA